MEKPSLIVHSIAPSRCPGPWVNEFVTRCSHRVHNDANSFIGRVRDAHCLVFARLGQDGTVAGIAALKMPRDTYREKLFRAAGVNLSPGVYPFELGWVDVSESHRRQGIGQQLCAEAMRHSRGLGVFATTGEDNVKMQGILKNLGLRPISRAYPSERTRELIRVYATVEET